MYDFSSAYRQLRTSERIFVDGYINELERHAARHSLRLEQCFDKITVNHLDQRSKDILNQALVRAAITERVKELTEEAELTVLKTLKELRGMAYSNLGNYMKIDDNGVPEFNLQQCTPEQLGAIKTIKIKEIEKNSGVERHLEFVLHDKPGSIKMLMQYQGLLDAEAWRNEQTKVNQQKTITADLSVSDAAELYARAIDVQ